MRHKIILPDLGQTTNEAKIVRWLKRPGEKVLRGEPLLEVETDKATVQIEAHAGGYLRERLFDEGDIVGVFMPLAILTDTPEESKYESSADAAATRSEAQPADFLPASDPTSAVEETLPRISGPSKQKKMAMYHRMVLCRLFEERVNSLFLQGKLPGTIHQAQGQEACAVGVCEALQQKDMITSTHRPHQHAVARGLPLRSLMAELFARQTGCCRGKGGSMHLGDPERGMLPAIAIVGGGIPLAAGYALSFQYQKQPNIVACFFGEGAANIGTFHEAINLAAIWDLPVIFVCENNKYGASTAVEKVMKVPRVSDRASAYGIPGVTVDGNDVEVVYRAALEAAARARSGKGPTLLELETYRFAGHSRSDPGHYRPREEVARWRLKDPIARFESVLLADGLLTKDWIGEIGASVERDLDDAVAFAEASPSPLPEECLTDVYAE